VEVRVVVRRAAAGTAAVSRETTRWRRRPR